MSSAPEKLQKNDRMASNPKGQLFPQEFIWLNDMDRWLDSLAFKNQNNPTTTRVLQDISYSLSYIQQDTWDEFMVIQKNARLLPEEINGRAKPEDIGRSVLVIIVANMANRLDHLTEAAIATADRFDSTMFERTIEEGRVADSFDRRITFSDMLKHIEILYKLMKLPSEKDTFNSIITAQKESIDLLNRGLNGGEMYSVEEAIASRENTVGAYYGVLARAATSDAQVQLKIEEEFRKCQLEDDVLDVGEDSLTQINPFVAALYHTGLLDEYIATKDKFGMDLLLDMFAYSLTINMYFYNISLNPVFLDSVRDQIQDNWIYQFLSDHSTVFEQYKTIFNQVFIRS